MVKLVTVDTEIRVRYKETDRMGIVHHSIIMFGLKWPGPNICVGRSLSYRKRRKGHIATPQETYCKYLQGALYDDLLIIRTTMTGFTGARITMEYEVIRKEDNSLLAKGKTVNALRIAT